MNDQVKELLKETLSHNGYSITKPRQLVFELLWDQEPQSMHELHSKSRGQLDRVSLYRIITAFEQAGIVQRVYVGWKYKLELTDIFLHHHHHISCLGCGKLVAIKEDAKIETLIKELAASNNFLASNHQLEVQGYCQDCQPPSHLLVTK